LFANKFKGDIEYGFSSNTNGSLHLGYKSFSISISYLIHQFGLIEPYVTAGFTSASFTAKNDYHASVNQNGGMLESITIDGNSKGLRIGGGILLNAGKHLIVNFNAVYNASPNTKIKNNHGYDLTGYQTEVNTNGFVTGISLIYK